MIRTAWRSLKFGFMKALVNRSNMAFWMVWRVTFFLTTVAIWTAIYADPQHDVIGGYTLPQMIGYYLLINVIFNFTVSFFEFGMVEEIRDGKMASSLTKPWGYIPDIITGTISWHIIQALMAIIVFWFLGILVGVPFGADVIIRNIPVFLLTLVFAIAIGIAISIMMGSLTFWLPEPMSMFGIKFTLLWMLGGLIVPYSVLPDSIRPFIEYSFFPSIAANPYRLLTNELSGNETLIILFQQIGWATVFGILAIIVWRKGLKTFESIGG